MPNVRPSSARLNRVLSFFSSSVHDFVRFGVHDGGMANPEVAARALDRDRGLQAVRSWTWTAGLAGVGLTGILAFVAAGSFAGHNAAAAAPAATDPGTSVDNSGQVAPQPAPQDSFGNSNQPPAAVSGGS